MSQVTLSAQDTLGILLADKKATEDMIAQLLGEFIARLPARVTVEEVEVSEFDPLTLHGGDKRYWLGVSIKLRL